VLLYSLYTTVLFLLFLVVNFPYLVFVQKILDEVDLSPATVAVEDADFAFWNGLELQGLTLRRAGWSESPILEISRAYLKAGLGGLVRGKLSQAKLRGDLYNGRMKAKWVGGGELQRTILQVEDVQVARYPPLREIFTEGQIYGLLSGFIESEVRGSDVNLARASGEIYLDRAGSEGLVYGGLPILDVAMDETKVLFNVQGGRIEIEEFSATGPDAIISGSGQIALREPIEASVVDLKLTIEATADARPEIKGLISLIPRERGAKPDAPVSITGTLAKPRFR
jgi:type II secretion system protein N